METQTTLGINEEWTSFILDFREDMELIEHNREFVSYMARYKNLSDFGF